MSYETDTTPKHRDEYGFEMTNSQYDTVKALSTVALAMVDDTYQAKQAHVDVNDIDRATKYVSYEYVAPVVYVRIGRNATEFGVTSRGRAYQVPR